MLIIMSGCIKKDAPEHQNDIIWTADDRNYLITELTRTRDEVISEIIDLSDNQWNFQESEERWSIAEIVEHQEVHDELYRREITVLTQLPEMASCYNLEKDQDEEILSYAHITTNNSGKSPWYLEPKGRWKSKEAAIDAFQTMRNKIIEFIQSTDKDLRKFYTPSGRGKAEVRDLHQLMLISIAHTDRHLKQLRRIKQHPEYPLD